MGYFARRGIGVGALLAALVVAPWTATAAAATGILATPASSTAAPAVTAAPGAAPPPASMPDDFTGVWHRDYNASNFISRTENPSTSKVFTLADGTPIPLKPDAQKLYRERVAMGETPNVFANTTAKCLPLGTPQNMMGAPPYLLHFVQTPSFIAILLEEGWEFRAIYINGKHPDELLPSFMGHSIGHWEGKTLVIETVALREETTLNFTGLPHSAAMKVIERIARADPDTLVDLIEIDDPVLYFKPFTFKSVFRRSSDAQIEYICEDGRIQVTSEGRQSYHAPQ